MAVASKAVFWNLSQVQVAKYAARLLEGYTPKHNMFDLLWHVLGKVLKLAYPELLALIHQRVVKIEVDDNQEILLHVDEAMEVLDEQDQKLLKTAKEVMLDGEQAQAVLREAYKLQASAFRGKQEKSIKVIPFPHHCEQRDAKKVRTIRLQCLEFIEKGRVVWPQPTLCQGQCQLQEIRVIRRGFEALLG